MRLARLKRVPAHVRDLQARVSGRDLVYFARNPAQTLGYFIFAAALRHKLHADADAEEGLALAAHAFFQRFQHAWHGIKSAPAIGESADARKHNARRPAYRIRIARHHNG